LKIDSEGLALNLRNFCTSISKVRIKDFKINKMTENHFEIQNDR